MSNFIKAVLLLLLFSSCNSKTESQQASEGASPKLYIKTTTTTGVDDNRVSVDTTTVVDSDTFEVTLSMMGMDLANVFVGGKDLERMNPSGISDGNLSILLRMIVS